MFGIRNKRKCGARQDGIFDSQARPVPGTLSVMPKARLFIMPVRRKTCPDDSSAAKRDEVLIPRERDRRQAVTDAVSETWLARSIGSISTARMRRERPGCALARVGATHPLRPASVSTSLWRVDCSRTNFHRAASQSTGRPKSPSRLRRTSQDTSEAWSRSSDNAIRSEARQLTRSSNLDISAGTAYTATCSR